MSTTGPRELMVLVERVVRPLRVPLVRRKRLRAEFLEHLQSRYAEELAIDGDPTGALARTRESFGDPDALVAELRQTVRWWEPWLCSSAESLAQRRQESTFRYVARVMVRYVLMMAVLLALPLIARHFWGSGVSAIALRASFGGLIFLSVWMSLFLFLSLKMGVELEQPTRRRRWVAFYAMLLVVTMPASVWLLMSITVGSLSNISLPIATTAAGGLLSVVCGALIGVLHHRETRYRHEWAELELESE